MTMQRNSLLLILLILLAGCGSRRQVATVTGAARETSDFFSAWHERYPPLRTFTARTSMAIRMPGSEMKSRVDMKIIRDSALQLSVQPLAGMEMLRMEFSRDSVKMVDRFNRQYLAESYTILNETSPVALNFFDLQALLLNRIFVSGIKEITPKQYNSFVMRHRDGLAELQTGSRSGTLYSFTADAEEKLLVTNIAYIEKHYNLLCRYSDFRPENAALFPMQMDMEVSESGRKALDLSISFSKIQRDAELSLSFPIPKNYKRVGLNELIKTLNLK